MLKKIYVINIFIILILTAVAFADIRVDFIGGGGINTTNCTVTTSGCDNNPTYQWGWRLLSNGSYVLATFNRTSAPTDTAATLVLEHLSSSSSGGPGGYNGYSPIDVIFNNNTVYPTASNFTLGTHGGTHCWDAFHIGAHLISGTNTLKILAKSLYTHYWIRNLWITSSRVGISEDLEHSGIIKTGKISLFCMPNPSVSKVAISYSIPDDSRCCIDIIDASGRIIKSIHDKLEKAGNHYLVWDGKDGSGRRCQSGIYFIKLTAGESDQIITKMVKMD